MWVILTVFLLPAATPRIFNSPNSTGKEEGGRIPKLFMLMWEMRGRTAGRTQVLCLDFNNAVIRTTLLHNGKSGLVRTVKWRFTN